MIRVLCFLLLALPAVAQESVIGKLSQNKVSITANFDGSEIFVYGAVKRDEPASESAPPLHVVITVEGPIEAATVRRKERVLGIWVNRSVMVVDQAPRFYTIATTGPLNEIMSTQAREEYGIGLDQVVRLSGPVQGIQNPTNFTDALIRVNQANGLYTQLDGSIILDQETLFSTHIALPSNLTEGDYVTRMFLLRGRDVVNVSETTIFVRKEGMERWIYSLAHEQPLIYGILSILTALLFGWGASELFRVLLRR